MSREDFLGAAALETEDPRFLSLLSEVLARLPRETAPLTTVEAVRLRGRGRPAGLAGLTHWRSGRQTLTFYSALLDELSDRAYAAVIVHELAHAWLNEHLVPEESPQRESQADSLAGRWGFGPELSALESETEPP